MVAHETYQVTLKNKKKPMTLGVAVFLRYFM